MTNKLKYFIGNWKMFGNSSSFSIVNKINKFAHKNKKRLNSKIVLCPPNTLINLFYKKLRGNSISLGAQNCHYSEKFGPFTGSVNASMIKKTGAKYLILGHSENRMEGESNFLIKKKIISALKQKLNIIFCIGETQKEKNKSKTFFILKKQINQSLERNFNKTRIIFAYEPVWAIGTNKIPEIDELKRNINFIKSEFKNKFKSKNSVKVLYGGSVNPHNIRIFSSILEIDGFLIGGASQSAKKFIEIIKNYYK